MYTKRKNTRQHFVRELYTEFHGTPISGSVLSSRSQIEIRTEGRSLHIRPLFSAFFLKRLKIGKPRINLLVVRRPTLPKIERLLVLSSEAPERNITSRCYRIEQRVLILARAKFTS